MFTHCTIVFIAMWTINVLNVLSLSPSRTEQAGEGVIGLQAGSNRGASQAGQNFGKTRAIID